MTKVSFKEADNEFELEPTVACFQTYREGNESGPVILPGSNMERNLEL